MAGVIFTVSIAASAQTAGGYGDVGRNSKEAKQAAAFAVKAQARKIGQPVQLIRIEKAESQVVAGINYRVCMDVREGRRKQKRVTAVVYRDLKQHLSLSRWRSGGCGEL
jgi:Cystatin domain